MRKLLALPLFLSASLAGSSLARAADPKCAHWFLKKDKDNKAVVENGQYVWADGAPADKSLKNCFADEIFVLDGDTKITVLTGGKPAVPGTPGDPNANPPVPAVPAMPAVPATPMEIDIVNCKAGMAAGSIDPKDCAIGDFAGQFNGGGIEGAALKALEQVKAKVPGAVYDEVVLFSADFGPATANGPLFFRARNGMNQPINEVANIGLPLGARDPNKPYVGLINAGNVKTLGANPGTGAFSACGSAPRRAIDDPTNQAAGALCAPGLYTYFDALAQATANIYGPFLTANPTDPFVTANGGTLSTMPTIKGTLVAAGSMGGAPTSKWPDGGLVTNVWNAFLNTQGSILGGNTWRDNGNATYTVTRPPAYQGVSAPFEGAQVLRFTPMDLYVMGFIPSNQVGTVQSLMHATPGTVFQPAVSAFSPAVGPSMGARLSGVSVRSTPTPANRSVPKSIDFGSIATANGGERMPDGNVAPQHIRQLWVLVTKPKKVLDASVAAAAAVMGAAADAGPKQTITELQEQQLQVELLQRFRADYNRYFHTLTGYKGRVLTHTEPNTDDMGYWEFGDSRDDVKEFQANGGLEMRIPGTEEIANSGGKMLSALRVSKTNQNGFIKFTPMGRAMKISGNLSTSSQNNILTVRMRVPKGAPGGLRSQINFVGSREVSIKFPVDESASLLADGVFHNYSVDLTKVDGWKDGVFNGFSFWPALSPDEVNDIDIEYIKVAWTPVANLKDSDLDCNKKDAKSDGWLDLEDNCKNLYNPDQADGNGDGIGDACEDYDGDNVVNSCDNCATVTNSSQRDGNNNGSGDACDGDKPADCFFQTSTVGGPVSRGSAVVWAAGLILGAIVTSAVRRRRRRR